MSFTVCSIKGDEAVKEAYCWEALDSVMVPVWFGSSFGLKWGASQREEIYLRLLGSKMARRESKIVVEIKKPPLVLFSSGIARRRMLKQD